jgi:hypothetical protein
VWFLGITVTLPTVADLERLPYTHSVLKQTLASILRPVGSARARSEMWIWILPRQGRDTAVFLSRRSSRAARSG